MIWIYEKLLWISTDIHNNWITIHIYERKDRIICLTTAYKSYTRF